MGGFAKVVSMHLPGVEITFFRNIFGVAIIGFSIYKFPLKQSGGRVSLLLFRGVMGFMALLSYFYIIAYMPLGEGCNHSIKDLQPNYLVRPELFWPLLLFPKVEEGLNSSFFN